MQSNLRYITTEKLVGETPLVALERARIEHGILDSVPLAYAGRLDPMASGKLLILIGDECKVQEKYHAFDKEYEVSILLGVSSDSGDVLGLIENGNDTHITRETAERVLNAHIGTIEIPYPHFSSKTVQGKPLHTWALEGRLHEIQVPVKKSRIYRLTYMDLQTISNDAVLESIRTKIETIPTVIEARKALGADFRREQVRASWDAIHASAKTEFQILSFTCTASSGSYMRSLGEVIGKSLGTTGLAYRIHRTRIGTYVPLYGTYGFWIRQF